MGSRPNTASTRRNVLRGAGGLLAGLMLPAHAVAAQTGATPGPGRPLFASACKDRQGRLLAVVFDANSGELVHRLELPERGHGITIKPNTGARQMVTFARRPGNFAVVLDLDRTREPLWLTTRPDRHFFGHGIFSADGRLLYTTENDFENGIGVIGVRDATDDYRQIGELPAGGIDPHECVMLADRRTLVIANGGIRTHPDEPRLENDTATMEPSLAYVDSATGDVVERHELPPDLHKLSIRHLCAGEQDAVVFGCQDRGPAWQLRSNVGHHRRGEPLRLIALPRPVDDRIRNYVGSVAVNRTGTIAAITAPRDGIAVLVDIATGRYLTHYELPHAYGVAARQDGGFLLSAEDGGMAEIANDEMLRQVRRPERLAVAWDNHMIPVGP